MANKATREPLGATGSGPRPGCFLLGSAQSRAAARALIEARKANEEEQGFQVVTRSIVDGSRVFFDGLADNIRAARMRHEGEGVSDLPLAIDGRQDCSNGGRAVCLEERITQARERVARMQVQGSTA